MWACDICICLFAFVNLYPNICLQWAMCGYEYDELCTHIAYTKYVYIYIWLVV